MLQLNDIVVAPVSVTHNQEQGHVLKVASRTRYVKARRLIASINMSTIRLLCYVTHFKSDC